MIHHTLHDSDDMFYVVGRRQSAAEIIKCHPDKQMHELNVHRFYSRISVPGAFLYSQDYCAMDKFNTAFTLVITMNRDHPELINYPGPNAAE